MRGYWGAGLTPPLTMVTRHPQRAEGPVCVIEYAIGREPYPKMMYCCGQFSPHCTFNSYGKSNEPWEPSKQVKQLPRLVMLGLQWSWVSLAFKVNIQCIVAYPSIFNANKRKPLIIHCIELPFCWCLINLWYIWI